MEQAWTSSDEDEQYWSGLWCNQCGKKEPDLFGLMEHNFVHLKDPPYKCNICPFFSNETSLLRYHMRGHAEENKQTWEQARITPWERSSFNWAFDEPRKPPPKRTSNTLYVLGLRLVPGKSKSCEPEAPQVENIPGRRISTLFEK